MNPGEGQGGTGALVDVGAGNPSAREARVARACEGAVGVGARRVSVTVVGPNCDRGAWPITSFEAPKGVAFIECMGSIALYPSSVEIG